MTNILQQMLTVINYTNDHISPHLLWIHTVVLLRMYQNLTSVSRLMMPHTHTPRGYEKMYHLDNKTFRGRAKRVSQADPNMA